jgi:hypothetical protein
MINGFWWSDNHLYTTNASLGVNASHKICTCQPDLLTAAHKILLKPTVKLNNTISKLFSGNSTHCTVVYATLLGIVP